jgi:hypothetical protein
MQLQFIRARLAAAALCGIASGQGVITTFAGADWVFSGDRKPAIEAPLGVVSGIAVDQGGMSF